MVAWVLSRWARYWASCVALERTLWDMMVMLDQIALESLSMVCGRRTQAIGWIPSIIFLCAKQVEMFHRGG